MIPTQTVHLEPLTSALLKELASQQGPCTTFLIRGTTGGGEGSSRAAALRGMLRSTPASLLGPDLLQPVEDFVAQFEDEAGGPGVALFRSPDYFVALTVTGLEANVVLRGNHFALAPLATAVLAPREFYVLALHSKNLHLLHYRNGACEPAPLPAGVPPDLETALAFDATDRLLEGRSASSRGGGAGHAIQFGTSSAKEAADEYLQQYFRIVDRGLRPLLGNMPLLLAGVHEDVTAYRRLATNTCILETEIGGNIDFLSPSEIASLATEAALAHYQLCGELVLRTHREMRHRERTLTDPAAILDAARAGRIHQLCAAGNFDPERTSSDDPLNTAIAETLRHNGEVFLLAPHSMPKGQVLAAILRY